MLNIIGGFSPLVVAGVGLSLLIIYGLSRSIYNIFFHPLAKFPGPKYAAISNAFYCWEWTHGRWPFTLEDLHLKYGPVVRYAPNDLDFATPEAYQDIHGHRKAGEKTFIKSKWYMIAPDVANGIVQQSDPIKHRALRKNLSHAFSAKALRTQTDVVLHFVNMWVSQVKKFGDTPEGINVEEWYNWLTFDIIGDLAFGESFGAVENAEGHEWPRTIKHSLHASIYTDVFRRMPILKPFTKWIRPDSLWEQRAKTLRMSRDLTEKRINRGNDREDFLAHLLTEKATDTSLDFLMPQANTLVIAGSETTATFLAGTTYNLLCNPNILHNLVQEVRSTFKAGEDITTESTASLPYLHAVIEEGLRIFPPVAAGLLRVSPGANVDGTYVPAGTSVCTSGWTTSHSPTFWHLPHEFHPERWLDPAHPLYDAAFSNDVKEASKPFLTGPRACLGINLAYLEMRIILARMLWEFDLEHTEQSKALNWNRDLYLSQLWMKPPLWVRFRPVVREKQKPLVET